MIGRGGIVMGDWQHIVEQVKEKVEKLTEKDSLICIQKVQNASIRTD